LDRSQKPSAKERAGGEQRLLARDTVAFEKEREEKYDGRYIIYYTFEDSAGEQEGPTS
jgi:hypothetical protein